MAQSNKRLLTFLIPLIIFVGLVIMLMMRLGKETDVQTSQLVGKPLPAFSLPLLSDPARTMTNADLPKQPFLLNVWGSWCQTCYVEHPFLLELHAKGVPMIGVNYKDELADALAYINKYQNPFIYSVQDYDGKYGIDLGLTGAPETIIVGADGLVYKHILGEVGEKNWPDIQACMSSVADDSLAQDAKLAACQ